MQNLCKLFINKIEKKTCTNGKNLKSFTVKLLFSNAVFRKSSVNVVLKKRYKIMTYADILKKTVFCILTECSTSGEWTTVDRYFGNFWNLAF